MELLQSLLLEVAVMVALAALTWLILQARNYLKAKLSAEHYALLDRLAEAAVWAIEQRGAGVFTSKKEAAMSVVYHGLKDQGIKLPTAQVDNAIEANVAFSFHAAKHTKETEL